MPYRMPIKQRERPPKTTRARSREPRDENATGRRAARARDARVPVRRAS